MAPRAGIPNDDIPESDRLEGFPHPREREVLVGHDDAARTFHDAFRSGRLHHAWILGGPQGIGKATLAYRAARFVLAHGDPASAPPPGDDPLAVARDHPAARQVAAQSHPDLLVLRRPWDAKAKQFKTTLPVDEVRRLGRFFGHTSGAHGWRVCIVDAADDMNVNAANALLKMLEEPPQRALFLLVSHVPGRLLATIRSRCRRLDLQPLTAPRAADVLAELLEGAGHAAARDTGALETAARIAGGSVGGALRLVAGDGLALHRALVALMETLPRLDIKKLHALADRLAPRAALDDYALFTDLLLTWLAAMVRTGATGEAQGIPEHEAQVMRRLAPRERVAAWAAAWETISHSIAQANALNLDRKQTILTNFFELEDVARGRSAA